MMDSIVWIERDYVFKTFRDTRQIVYYDKQANKGVYEKNGERLIEEKCVARFPHISSYCRNEIINTIKIKSYVDRSELDKDLDIINLKNGLYHVSTNTLTPHTPDHFSMNQKPFVYDPKACCPGFLRYLVEDLYVQDIPTIADLMAYSFHRQNIIEFDSIAVLTGDGSNGKGVVTSILGELHGDTASNVPLDLMSDDNDKFAVSHLVNKDVNIDIEVNSKTIKDISKLKRLTGSHAIWVQEKGEKGFDARIHAKIWLSGNNLKITDGSGASDRRLRFISFKRRFEANEADKNLKDRLIATELPGIFNMLMRNLRMLLKTKTIRVHERDIDERIVKNAMVQAPIKYFIEEYTVVADGLEPRERDVDKVRVHKSFEGFCDKHGLPKTGYQQFCGILKKEYGWVDWKPRTEKKKEGDTGKVTQYRLWKNHMLKPQCVSCGLIQEEPIPSFKEVRINGQDEWACEECKKTQTQTQTVPIIPTDGQ